MMERWRTIPGWENRYEVSDRGRVRSLQFWEKPRRRPKLKRLSRYPSGYVRVTLYRGTRQKGYMVHQLVALAFIGPRPKGQQVRHRDGTRANNAPRNLEYGTPSENRADSIRHGTWAHGERVNTAKLTAAQVKAIRKAYRPRKVTRVMLAKRYGVTVGNICQLVRRKTWKHLA